MTENSILTNKLVYNTDSKLPSNLLEEMLITAKGTRISSAPAQIGDGNYENNVVNKEIRSSSVYFLCWDTWVAGILHNMFISANNDFFHYDIDHFDSGIQTTFYQKGDYYDWHSDGKGGTTPTQYERKLSMSFLLTDDYEGGELELESKPSNFVLKPKAGTAVIFPSWLPHKVKPVISGERISLVAWMNGPYFK